MEVVRSVDGTVIAYKRTGDGPALVLVHGTGRDHTLWEHSLSALTRQTTIYAIDRRGRGASGNANAYSLDREVEDVIAVVAMAGETVSLLGHSYGAIVALEVELRANHLHSLILYEPSITVGTD